MKTAIIKILGKDYSAEGETVKEALMNLQFTGFAGVKSFLTVRDSVTNAERTVFLPPIQTKRLFAPNKLAKEIAVKQTAMRFE